MYVNGTMKTRTIVIKLGTSTLTGGTKALDREHMMEIVRQCAKAQKAGHKVIIVSSGAIAAGREHLGNPDLPGTMSSKQLLAAVGQSRLIQLWEQLFAIYGLHVGQMLLTRADLEDKERFLNARDMLGALLEHGVIPVINENDAVATTEIRVGDNDNLSALAAMLAGADRLLLLTDQQGLYDSDPNSNSDAKLISSVAQIDENIRALAGGSISGLGTGGMSTKIQAAEVATRAGIEVVIASGQDASLIGRIIDGEHIGTWFSPSESPLEKRKRWLFGAPPAGEIAIDAGAVTALTKRGSSLLPKGITGVSGAFSRGAVVRIVSPEGRDLAHGVTQYNSEALARLAGHHSGEIAKLVGYEYGPVAVHRDDLILLGV